jgi:glycosyltransferase involved in cell wall biosynthesis
MRYVWDQFDAYFGRGRVDPITRAAAHLVAPWLRRWDVRSTARAHALIANSTFVSERMRRVWGRPADAVIYPPVETSRFRPARDLPAEARGARGYALIVSALVPYKRIELAVRAFTQLGRRLLVAGDGPELPRLRAEAGASIAFLGGVPHEQLPDLYAHAAFFVLPGEEDFGIAPVEAQSAGRPVLALGRGGALETVVAGQTGLFFDEPSVESLLQGVRAMDGFAPSADPDLIHAHAERFAAPRFITELREALARFA